MFTSQLKEYNKTPNRIQNQSILSVNVEKLSHLIKRRMRELGIKSNVELANSIGISRAYLGNMINETAPTKSGQYNPSPEVIAGIAKHLKVSQGEVLDAIGYDTSNEAELKKPINPAEFFEALDKLGLDIQFSGGRKVLEGLDEDDLQELLDGVIANATAKGRRKQKERI